MAEINLANHFEVCFSDDLGYLFSDSVKILAMKIAQICL